MHHDPGSIIRQARAAVGWSQQKLGESIGASQGQVSLLELGVVGRALTVLDNALSERVQASVVAGRMDAAASEALAAVQSFERPLAVAA